MLEPQALSLTTACSEAGVELLLVMAEVELVADLSPVEAEPSAESVHESSEPTTPALRVRGRPGPYLQTTTQPAP